jgi:acyl phosphate:glycerol-3-phosphate acyltransferase
LITWLALVLIAFLCGSLPFSVWLGRLFLGLDVRRFGDGNPGAANVFKSGGRVAGLLALVLDVSKAAVPVGLAYYNLGIRGLSMALIAIAPVLGHAFSPFLGFRGGKALATVLGTWIGLTLWKVSLAAVVGVLIGMALFTTAGWAVMLALAVMVGVIMVWLPDPLLLLVWAGEVLILVWTHRMDLACLPRLRPWLINLFSRSGH